MPEKLKVLITGGAGFIGSHVVDGLISRGYSVKVLDNLSTGNISNISGYLSKGMVELVEGDIRNLELVKKTIHGVSIVIHAAAITSVPFSLKNPEQTVDVNVGGTVKLLASAIEARVEKFIFVSSCAVYGDPKFLPVKETHPTSPISPYAESKTVAEHFTTGFSQRHLIKSVVLRLFNVYGPRQGVKEYSGVITRFFDCCNKGLPLTIYGDGSQTRDFIHVIDVTEAILNASELEGAEGQTFNIGSGKPTSIQQLAQEVFKINCSLPKLAYARPRPGDINHSYADISKAQQFLKFKPKYTLETGLRALLRES